MFHFPFSPVSCVKLAHPSSLDVLIVWFSFQFGPLIWGIGTQWFLKSAMGRLRSLTGV
jgi:hypothetical protein